MPPPGRQPNFYLSRFQKHLPALERSITIIQYSFNSWAAFGVWNLQWTHLKDDQNSPVILLSRDSLFLSRYFSITVCTLPSLFIFPKSFMVSLKKIRVGIILIVWFIRQILGYEFFSGIYVLLQWWVFLSTEQAGLRCSGCRYCQW